MTSTSTACGEGPLPSPHRESGKVKTLVSAGGPALEDDEASFEEAMRDVVPLSPADRLRMDGPPPAGRGIRPPVTDDAEALAILGDLVAGNGPFDITDTDEYIEGRADGVDPRIVRRLRRGDFDRQRNAVELLADESDRRRVGIRQCKCRLRELRTFDEQPHRFEL